MSRNYMSKYDEMRKGDYLMSNNHKWKACFHVCDNKMIWQTKCPVSGGCAMMCRIWLCNDGTMVVERDGEEVWSSNNE
uniref:Bulb-type lectin domain-containing protein n=1 Tax=Oncorhynchus tshawytscha TaxID=74940 RepID=A0A8C8GVD2_ONCTS